MTQPLIQARGLTKSYGETPALQPLDWKLAPGSVAGILGPNGAGKTTLAKLILGITRPSAGTVSVLGRDVAGEPREIRRAVGFLPEEKVLYGDMRGTAFLSFYGSFFPDFQMNTAEKLLSAWEIPLKARIKELSKGNRAKLALAAVLARRPRILLLDEPTLDLDPASTEEVLSLVAGWVAEGERGVVITTHRLEEVERICDRVLCLLKGAAVAEGDLDDLREDWRLVRVTGPLPSEAELEAWEGVRSIQRGEGWGTLVLEGGSEAVVRRLREGGATEVVPEHMTLRDIYLTLVNHDRNRLDGVLERWD